MYHPDDGEDWNEDIYYGCESHQCDNETASVNRGLILLPDGFGLRLPDVITGSTFEELATHKIAVEYNGYDKADTEQVQRQNQNIEK
jgi:hypothetical protein